jgi:adenylosuccinate synthase
MLFLQMAMWHTKEHQHIVVIGCQWGDEGKGKIVDYLAQSSHVCVRAQGGHNAGHTIMIDQRRHVLQLVPCGIFHPQVTCVLAHGMVVSPDHLLKELQHLPSERVQLSYHATVLLPTYFAMDANNEQTQNIGTTKNGIGPAYSEKAARRALRFTEYLKDSTLKTTLYQALGDTEAAQRFYDHRTWLTPLLTDTVATLKKAHDDGQHIVFEGAQGFGLDIDMGTYPYVTSSSTGVGGVITGTGFNPNHLSYVLGVVKAYTTRVGNGPFPTEDHTTNLGELGHEWGSVTGRKRRCGWLDLWQLRTTLWCNGVHGLVITKLDVLDTLSTIPVAIDRQSDGTVVYDYLPGWCCSIKMVRNRHNLPLQAKQYMTYIENFLNLPIVAISNGPNRHDLIT